MHVLQIHYMQPPDWPYSRINTCLKQLQQKGNIITLIQGGFMFIRLH